MSLKTNTIKVNVVNDLFNTVPANGDQVETLGYHDIGDGGANLYVYRATGRSGVTTDSGFYLSGSGSDDYFEAVDKSIANVKQFGATGDNSTDDTDAIQSAIDAATNSVSAGYNPVVYIPKGVFRHGPLTTGSMIIRGDGDRISVLNFVPTADNQIGLRIGAGISKDTASEIRNLGIISGETGYDGLSLIKINLGSRTIIDSVRSQYQGTTAYDISAIELAGQEQTRLSNLTLIAPIPIHVSANIDNGAFWNIYYRSNFKAPSYPRTAIYVDDDVALNRCVFEGHQTVTEAANVIYWTYDGSQPNQPGGFTFRNLRAEQAASSGYTFHITGPIRRCDFENIRISSSSASGWYLQDGVQEVLIDGVIYNGANDYLFDITEGVNLTLRSLDVGAVSSGVRAKYGDVGDFNIRSGVYQLSPDSRDWLIVIPNGLSTLPMHPSINSYAITNSSAQTITGFDVTGRFGSFKGNGHYLEIYFTTNNTTLQSGSGSGSFQLLTGQDVTPPANSFMRFTVGGGQLREIFRSWEDSYIANVRDYGATGDGSTDDTDAIQAAIDTTLPVYLPTGNYVVSDSLTLSPNQSIRGNGTENSVLQIAEDGFAGAVIYMDDGCEVHDLSIQEDGADPDKATTNTCYGVSNGAAQNTLVRNVYVKGLHIPFLAQNTTNVAINVRYENCEASHSRAWGFEVDGTKNVSYSSCLSHNNGLDGFKAQNESDVVSENLLYDSCVAHNNGQRDSSAGGSESTNGNGWDLFHGGYKTRLINCSAYENYGGGFIIKGGSSPPTMGDCSFNGCHAYRQRTTSGGAQHGFELNIENSMRGSRTILTDCQAYENPNAGFFVASGAQIRLTNCISTLNNYGVRVAVQFESIRSEGCIFASNWLYNALVGNSDSGAQTERAVSFKGCSFWGNYDPQSDTSTTPSEYSYDRFDFTADSGTDVITATGHNFSDDDRVVVIEDNTLPGGLAEETWYYVINSASDTLQLSLTKGGSAVDITSNGSSTNIISGSVGEGLRLYSDTAGITVEDCDFGAFTVGSGALRINSERVYLNRCTVWNTYRTAIYIPSSGSVKIRDCRIFETQTNKYSGTGWGAIRIDGSADIADCHVENSSLIGSSRAIRFQSASTNNRFGINTATNFSESLSVATGAEFINSQVFDVTYFGAQGDGSTNDTNTIQRAINALTDGGTVFFPRGTYQVDGSVTSPYNVTLKFDKGAVVAVDSAGSFAISGEVDAGDYLIFDADSGDVTIDVDKANYPSYLTETNPSGVPPNEISPYQRELSALWFAGGDIGEKINKAFAAGGSRTKVVLPTGTYVLSTTIDMSADVGSHICLQGQSHIASTMTIPANSAIIGINCRGSDEALISNIRVTEETGGSTCALCYLGGTSLVIENCWFGGSKYGLYTNSIADFQVRGGFLEFNDYDIFLGARHTDFSVSGLDTAGSSITGGNFTQLSVYGSQESSIIAASCVLCSGMVDVSGTFSEGDLVEDANGRFFEVAPGGWNGSNMLTLFRNGDQTPAAGTIIGPSASGVISTRLANRIRNVAFDGFRSTESRGDGVRFIGTNNISFRGSISKAGVNSASAGLELDGAKAFNVNATFQENETKGVYAVYSEGVISGVFENISGSPQATGIDNVTGNRISVVGCDFANTPTPIAGEEEVFEFSNPRSLGFTRTHGDTGWIEGVRDQDYLNVRDFGALGDGSTDDTSAIQSAINLGINTFFPSGIYAIEDILDIPATASLIFSPQASLKVNADISKALRLDTSGGEIFLDNCTIDCNNLAEAGLTISSVDNVSFRGVTTISNVEPSGANTNGGIIADSCSNLSIDSLKLNNIRQSGGAGLYRGIDLSNCDNVSIGDVFLENGDIAVNIYATTDVKIDSVFSRSLTDNGVYILNASENINIGEVLIDDCGEGIVLDTSVAESNISIGTVTIDGATANGIILRSGGGYSISHASLRECGVATSSGSTVDGARFGNLSIWFDSNTSIRPITLDGADNIVFGSVNIMADSPLAAQAVRLEDSTGIVFGSLKIRGIGGSPISTGLYITGASNNNITVGNLYTINVNNDYSIVSSTGNKDTIYIGNTAPYGELLGSSYHGGVSMELKSLNSSNTAGDLLGEISVYGSDASNPGTKFKIETTARNGNGGGGRTLFLDDSGNTVGYIREDAVGPGMTIVLPTSSTGLPSGSLWNNGGSIEIV